MLFCFKNRRFWRNKFFFCYFPSDGEIYDKYGDHVTFFPDVPEILEKLTQEGYVVAAASRLGLVHTVCVCVCLCYVSQDMQHIHTKQQERSKCHLSILNAPCEFSV